MDKETAQKVIQKMSWEITKCERFLGMIAKANTLKPKDRDNVLKGACWIDGTLPTQISYTMKRREKLFKARAKLLKKY